MIRPAAPLALVIAYRGTEFHGFAPQPGVRTVGGALSAAIERMLRHPVELSCAGRTDAGVHAWGQVVTFPVAVDTNVDPAAVQRGLNRALGPAIVVRKACLAPAGFNARRSAISRCYRYTVLNRAVADPFRADTSWHVAGPLDVGVMRLACDPLYGEHDFASFCRRTVGGSLVRRVSSADWSDLGEGVLCFEIEASSFCQQMVRSLVGTMVEMGLAKKKAGEMAGILRARDRHAAGELAPPHGLCLWEVRY